MNKSEVGSRKSEVGVNQAAEWGVVSRGAGGLGRERMFLRPFYKFSFSVGVVIALMEISISPAVSLPPPEETPEEVLRTEIIIEARSPVDGKALTAAEYAELQVQLQTDSTPPELNSAVQERIFLLRLRRAIRTVLPFLPI